MSPLAMQEYIHTPETAIGHRERISYTNSYGKSSIRIIKPLRIYRGGNGFTYVSAYCHLRHEERTFRLDRVRLWEQIGVAEGEEIQPPSERIAETFSRKQPVSSSADTPHAQRLGDPSDGTVLTHRPEGSSTSGANSLISQGDTTTPTIESGTPRHPARRRHPFRTLLLLVGIFLGGRWLVISGTAEDILLSVEHALSGQTVPEERERYMPDNLHKASPTPTSALTATTAAGKTSSTPSSKSNLVQRLTYRGVDIIAAPLGDAYHYSAPALSLSADNQRALHLQINARLFRRDTGINNSTLENLYAGADTDRDGYLCWKEIREFQGRITRRYEYQNNTTALRPDEFLAQGGGDCEDWALVTCGLLCYWGWDGYVASFFPPRAGDGHALCMVRWTDLPRGFDYHTVEPGATTVDGSPIRPGYYVPIDYEVVGGSSSAVKRNWILRDFYTPEKIYGRVM